jgi:hypothetical protein
MARVDVITNSKILQDQYSSTFESINLKVKIIMSASLTLAHAHKDLNLVG